MEIFAVQVFHKFAAGIGDNDTDIHAGDINVNGLCGLGLGGGSALILSRDRGEAHEQ
jgi:hypothetical protein